MKFFILIIVLFFGFILFKRWVNKFFWKGYSYTKKEYTMTQPERDCFNALVKVVGDTYWVFPQVHFSTFLDNHVIGQNWDAAFWHINGKSVDFLLCTKERLSPKLAIELDDKSHERQDRQNRDSEEERMFKTANMPLLRLQHIDIDNLDYLSRKITEALNPQPQEPVKLLTWYQKLLILIK